MTQRASELLQKALSLSEEERAELAGSLIEALDSGKAKTVPWEAVRFKL